MSTYLAATEVSLLLPAAASVTDTSRPINLSEIASWSFEVGAAFDAAAAAAGYAVPITPSTPNAYAQARDIVRHGVTCRVLRVLAPNVMDSTKAPISKVYCDAYDAAMKDLREGKTPLVGAPQDTGSSGRELPRSFETSNVGATVGGASPLLSVRGMVF